MACRKPASADSRSRRHSCLYHGVLKILAGIETFTIPLLHKNQSIAISRAVPFSSGLTGLFMWLHFVFEQSSWA
jgi:hypothetical protein